MLDIRLHNMHIHALLWPSASQAMAVVVVLVAWALWHWRRHGIGSPKPPHGSLLAPGALPLLGHALTIIKYKVQYSCKGRCCRAQHACTAHQQMPHGCNLPASSSATVHQAAIGVEHWLSVSNHKVLSLACLLAAICQPHACMVPLTRADCRQPLRLQDRYHDLNHDITTKLGGRTWVSTLLVALICRCCSSVTDPALTRRAWHRVSAAYVCEWLYCSLTL